MDQINVSIVISTIAIVICFLNVVYTFTFWRRMKKEMDEDRQIKEVNREIKRFLPPKIVILEPDNGLNSNSKNSDDYYG